MTLTETRNGAAHAAAAAPRTGPATPALFEADNISIAFGGIRAVDGVSFDVKEGEIFAIVGPNGAGKSTIFNLISRIYEPTGGRLVFEGEDITNVAPHSIAGRGIARTFQNIELFEHATVLDNLLIGRHCRAKPKLLLLDEPASGLNTEETEEVAFWIDDIKNDLGVTVIMIEHDMSLVSAVSNRVLALNNGRTLALGTPSEVQSNKAVIEAYLGSEAE